MSFLVWIIAALSDLVLIAMCALVFCKIGGVFAIVLIVMGYKAWVRSGGWSAWHPPTIREFFKNWKEHSDD